MGYFRGKIKRPGVIRTDQKRSSVQSLIKFLTRFNFFVGKKELIVFTKFRARVSSIQPVFLLMSKILLKLLHKINFGTSTDLKVFDQCIFMAKCVFEEYH